MDKKNNIILLLTVALFTMIFLFVYSIKKQQDLQQQLIRNLEYNSTKSVGDNKGKPKDPYKDIAVKNALRKQDFQIQECYNEFLKSNPQKVDGFVEIDWNILEDGKVERAELVSSNLNSHSLNQCILKIISSIEFPSPLNNMQTYITYKYNFKKTE